MKFRNKEIIFSDEKKFFNLKTSNLCKTKPKNDVHRMVSTGCYISGTRELLDEFDLENSDNCSLPDKIELYNVSQINCIQKFSFEGLNGYGKIKNVIDGDTIDLAIKVPLSFFSPNAIGSFPTILRIRLFGIDVAEKNTLKGKLAIKMFKELYDSIFNVVYFELLHFDLYGRILANLYTRKNGSHINFFFLNHIDTTTEPHGPFILKYDGSKKSDYLKELP